VSWGRETMSDKTNTGLVEYAGSKLGIFVPKSNSIAICDDENAEREYLQQLVKNWAKSRDFHLKLLTFPNAEAFLFEYVETSIDIVLLDIKMGNMDGITLAKRLRKMDDHLQIVFVTGMPDYISEGYEVSALHYLMKPVSGEKLNDVLDRAVKRLSMDEATVLLQLKDGKQRLPIDSVYYAEAFSHDILLHSIDGNLSLKTTLNELEGVLGEGFFRCHRSFLVNMRHVRKVTKNSMEMDNGSVLPLSRKAAVKAMEAFLKSH